MSIYIIIGVVLVALTIAAAAKVRQIRECRIKDSRRRHISTYILNRLTQQTFTKAVNIVTDLVERDGADIEVIYNDEVIFNGYMDYSDEDLQSTPRFWYNKKVLDAHGIEY